MQTLKLSGAYQKDGTWIVRGLNGYIVHDYKKKTFYGYLSKFSERDTFISTNYISGNYNQRTGELVFIEEVSPEPDSKSTLYIFDDVDLDGIWGEFRWESKFYHVSGLVSLNVEDTEKTIPYIDRKIEEIEKMKRRRFNVPNLTQYVRNLYPEVFDRYFWNVPSEEDDDDDIESLLKVIR